MIVGLENLRTWFRQNESPFWKLRASDKGDIICESPEKDGLNLQSSEDRLFSFLTLFSAGHSSFYLETWHTEGQKKERYKVKFQLENNGSSYNGGNISGAPAGFISASDAQRMVTEATDKMKRELEMSEMKKQLADMKKELKEGSPTALDRVIGKLEPHITPYFPQIMAKIGFDTPVHKVSGNKHNLSEEQYQEKVEKAAESLAESDEDFPFVMEKLAKLAKEDKATYEMAKGILNSKFPDNK